MTTEKRDQARNNHGFYAMQRVRCVKPHACQGLTGLVVGVWDLYDPVRVAIFGPVHIFVYYRGVESGPGHIHVFAPQDLEPSDEPLHGWPQ